MESNNTTGPAILRMAEVTRTVGLARATVYRMMQRGEFPASVPLSGCAVGWLRSEIESWIASRVEARNAHYAKAA